MNDLIKERDLGVLTPTPTDLVRLVRAGQSASGYASLLPTPAGAQRQIDNLVAGQTTSTLYRSTWASLSGVAGAFAGQGAQVVNDGGSHLDPVSGVSVSNAGTYTWTGAAWQWLRGDTMADKSDWANVDQQLELNAWTLNATGSGIVTFKGTYPVSGGVMALVFTAGSIGLRDKRGSGVTNFYTMTLASETTIQLGSGQVLVWNLDPEVNAFQVLTNGSTRPAKYALIAYVRSGQIVAGLLMDVIARQADDMREYQLVLSPWYTDGLVSDGGTAVTVNLAATALFLVAGTGKQVQTLTSGTYPTAFSVPANSVLLWDLVRNAVAVYSNNSDKPTPHVLLVNSRTGGHATVGALTQTRNSFEATTGRTKYDALKSSFDTLNSRTVTKYSHITFSREGSSASPIASVSGATVSVTGLTMFAIGWDGANVKQLNGVGTAITTTWTFADNEVLIWNWDGNTVQKINNNAARPAQFVTLLMRKNGTFVAGAMLPLLQAALLPENVLADSQADMTESRCIVVNGKFSAQGLTIVRDKVWSFDASLADHSTTAGIIRYWADLEGGFAGAGNLTHNFGHVATADYDPRSDVMCMGNGEGSTSVLPRIDLLLNASSYNAVDNVLLDFNDPVGTPRVSIEFFVRDGGGAVTKEIGGSGAVCCWGEDVHILYMMTGQGSVPHRIFKVVLGTGSNDFSDPTGTDLARWGTFVAGKGADEYNGTALVYQIYTGKEYNVSQGMAFHDGKLFYGITSTSSALEVIEVSCRENGTFRTDRKFRYRAIRRDGTKHAIETEDCCIFAGRYLLAGGRESGTYYWCLFPLYNEMGGKGVVGVPITFPFPCNQVPQPLISAVGPTADLYIEVLDREGFTVASVADAAGEFHWSARIA